ncbi:hypothetical protein [Thomasclavelia sp.]|uniref:hypothetical protein n=1 Tax=Thomasclavelia sp. TaxID=3025757 RepID=UPI0025CC7CEF|nr:hypothetical protein [Thomasclavelia sp.]
MLDCSFFSDEQLNEKQKEYLLATFNKIKNNTASHDLKEVNDSEQLKLINNNLIKLFLITIRHLKLLAVLILLFLIMIVGNIFDTTFNNSVFITGIKITTFIYTIFFISLVFTNLSNCKRIAKIYISNNQYQLITKENETAFYDYQSVKDFKIIGKYAIFNTFNSFTMFIENDCDQTRNIHEQNSSFYWNQSCKSPNGNPR